MKKCPCYECLILPMCRPRYHRLYKTRRLAEYEEIVCISDSLLIMRIKCETLKDYFNIGKTKSDSIDLKKTLVHKHLIKGYYEQT